MRIPKYISHPLLLIAGGGLIALLIWVAVPSSQQIENSIVSENPHFSEDWQNQFVKIINVDSSGAIQTTAKGPNSSFKFSDKRFQNLTEQQIQNMKQFLVDKYIKKSDLTAAEVALPFSLWDKTCFKNNQTTLRKEVCPLVFAP